jgi:hypothetical protein
MSFSMNLWEVNKDSLIPIKRSQIDLESQLEDWISSDPSILNLDVLVIGRQVHTMFGGYIDLLCINREGDLIIVELKRDKTPRDVVAQCLDYASWVCDLGFEEINTICQKRSGKAIGEAYHECFDDPIPETINENHQMVIVAVSLDDSTERIIQYLTEKHSMNINAVFFNAFEINGKQVIGRSFFKDPEEVEEKSNQGKRAAWTGYLFVNSGIDFHDTRDWSLNTKYNYISAGYGKSSIQKIKKLKTNDKIFAYISGSGYVGYGVVEEPATPVTEFEHDGNLLIDQLPSEHAWRKDKVDDNNGEWLVKIKWLKTFTRKDAKWLKNGFANPNIVCKLRDKRTFEYLKKEFEVDIHS